MPWGNIGWNRLVFAFSVPGTGGTGGIQQTGSLSSWLTACLVLSLKSHSMTSAHHVLGRLRRPGTCAGGSTEGSSGGVGG